MLELSETIPMLRALDPKLTKAAAVKRLEYMTKDSLTFDDFVSLVPNGYVAGASIADDDAVSMACAQAVRREVRRLSQTPAFTQAVSVAVKEAIDEAAMPPPGAALPDEEMAGPPAPQRTRLASIVPEPVGGERVVDI